MKQRFRAVLDDNLVLGPHTFVLRLSGCQALAGTLPGQFVMLAAEDWGTDPLLPRAFSLLAVRPDGTADVLVKTTGKASALLERARPGAGFYLLGPLGRPFAAPAGGRTDWLVAGGVGLAPLFMQCEAARAAGLARQVTMFYGGRSAADLVMLDDIVATGAELVLASEDGSRGQRGYVTAAVERALDASPGARPTLMACGPEPMLRAVAQLAHRRGLPAQLSLEGEMACGVGACLVCAVPCKTKNWRYTCVDGPVFDLAELAGPYAPAAGGDA
ncbi:MAG TPA: dihydroorotate dehydrogenase electron transfer subunit [Kofleriaceae bacterium]|nr:dihydroorotate dehydrogenase electron transfer subunit [Kofleriaceae bacterium]